MKSIAGKGKKVISIKKIFTTILSFKSTYDKLHLYSCFASIYAQKIIRDTLGST